MRLLLVTVLLGLGLTSSAVALFGGTTDSGDRFPFVVEVKFHDELICSGTVLFPRIVVTAAHCVQYVAQWRGHRYPIDDYLQPAELSVIVTRHGQTSAHAVASVQASPVWRRLTVKDTGSGERFAHDLALIITKEPLDVGLPSSLAKLAHDELVETKPGLSPVAVSTDVEKEEMLRAALAKRLTRHGVLVSFGAGTCRGLGDCGDAGIRRYQPVALKESADCFNDARGKPRWPPLPAELSAKLPLAVWCMDSRVMPGDSGGALLVEGSRGEFYYLGVISAQQGTAAEIVAGASKRKSVATALYPSLGFISDEARKLGYLP